MKNDMTGIKILLVEDEETLAVGLEYNLSDEGYSVDWAKDGRKAVELFNTCKYDLIILDLMLPYLNGFEVAAIIREKNPQMPILMLTARTAAEDKVRGLEIGADDYLTKPFNLKELLLRIKGMLKRKMWYKSFENINTAFKFGDNEIDFEKFEAQHGSKRIRLSQREAMIMKYLIENKGRTITRKELLENVWNINPDVETRTVDIFISRLRKYFESDPLNPVHIISVRGAGYIFELKDN